MIGLGNRSAVGSLEHSDQLGALCAGRWLIGTAYTGRGQIRARSYGFGAGASLLRFPVNRGSVIGPCLRSCCRGYRCSIGLSGHRSRLLPRIATRRLAFGLASRFVCDDAGIDLCFCLGLCLLAGLPSGHGRALQIRTAPVAMLAPPQARRWGQAGAATEERGRQHRQQCSLWPRSRVECERERLFFAPSESG